MIPSLITKGTEKGKLWEYIEVRFEQLDVDIEDYLLTKDDLILSAQGSADVQLQKELFKKKKPG